MSSVMLMANDLTEVRLLTIADPHMAATSPESWKANYKEVVEATINQVLDYGVKQHCHAVLWAGDIFHRKSPTRNPLGFVEDCMRLMKKSRNFGVAGNHDEKYGSLEGLKGQPLSLLIEAGVFQLLDTDEYLIQADGFSVRLAGASYEHGRAEGCRDKTKKGATWLVSVGHFWFGKEDGVFNGEPLFSPTFLGQGEPDIYVLGHKHDDQGIIEVGGKMYVVPGSISLTGEKATDGTRKPGAAIIRITKDKFTAQAIRPKVPPIADLIDLEKRAEVINESHALEEFVESIAQAKLTGTDPQEILKEMDLTKEVREKVQHYLELAEAANGR